LILDITLKPILIYFPPFCKVTTKPGFLKKILKLCRIYLKYHHCCSIIIIIEDILSQKVDIGFVTGALLQLKPEDRNYMRFLAQTMLLVQDTPEIPVFAGYDRQENVFGEDNSTASQAE
jgi:hypothetical protein